MIFVIPMAGEGRRFVDAGYGQPKYRLEIHGAPLFDHAVGSFSTYFQSDSFLFVVRDGDGERFVRQRCAALSVRRTDIVTLAQPTSGQAESVLCGLDKSGIDAAQSIAVFNIDTFRPAYRKPSWVTDRDIDGYVEVFRGTGTNWSFVAPNRAKPRLASETAEKRPISDLCCTGLYYFRRAGDFRWAYHNPAPPKGEAERSERYVAPLYNALIGNGCRIGIEIIPSANVIFSGTPEEYEQAAVSAEAGRRLKA